MQALQAQLVQAQSMTKGVSLIILLCWERCVYGSQMGLPSFFSALQNINERKRKENEHTKILSHFTYILPRHKLKIDG